MVNKEDTINEPKLKCDYCRKEIEDEHDHFRHDDLDICDSCHEGSIA